MSNALATVETQDGRTVRLSPGDLIGRAFVAALRVDDVQVSEAHAFVSLRGGELRALRLRGPMAVDGVQVNSVALQLGTVVSLTPTWWFRVTQVHLPSHVTALQIGDGEPVILMGAVNSVVLDPIRVVSGAREHAPLVFLSTGAGLRVSRPEHPVADVSIGDHWSISGDSVRVVLCHSPFAETVATEATSASGPLRLVANFDSLQIHRPNSPVTIIGGRPARLVHELLSFGGSMDWERLADEIWRDVDDPFKKRKNYDMSVVRLQRKLRDANVRGDLIAKSGSGQLDIVLRPGDVAEIGN